MKTKAIGIGCLILAIGLSFRLVGHSQAPSLPSGQSGRYQIVNAAIDFSATGGMPAKQTVVRVDTQTGKAWELFEQKGSSGGVETLWLPIFDMK
jgi:hypothetical protein